MTAGEETTGHELMPYSIIYLKEREHVFTRHEYSV